ncbi:hypothetical protein [Nonomuraea sp. NPDC050540]|uniref:hypothetical protein n=1 Tax=Nonomuraea sp. NPDC050540 TaxID=3364367 RepID=UPI00379FA72A
MPKSLEEHYAFLQERGAEFDPYVHVAGPGSPLLDRQGRRPRRDAERELRRLRDYWETVPRPHRDEVESMAALCPAMSEDCRIAVFIPSRYEAQSIGETVRLLTEQTDSGFAPLRPEAYEILILNNVFEGEEFDSTASLVRDHCVRHGLTNVHVIDIRFPKGAPCPLTLACRYLVDLIVFRALSRRRYRWPLYMAAEDADLVWTDPRQLWTQLETLDRRPELDAVRGGTDRCPWIYTSNDLVTVMRRSWNITESYFRLPQLRAEFNPDFDFRWNRVATNGWNTAFTAEAYAMIRGYTPDRWLGNDADIGEKVSIIRGTVTGNGVAAQTHTVELTRQRAEGSPRRWLLQANDGISPYDRAGNYRNFYSNETLQNLVEKDLPALLSGAQFTARISADNVHRFEAELTDRWRTIAEVRKNQEAARRQAVITFGLLGLGEQDWDLDGEQVRILNITGLREALDNVRAAWAGQGPRRRRPSHQAAAPVWFSYV